MRDPFDSSVFPRLKKRKIFYFENQITMKLHSLFWKKILEIARFIILITLWSIGWKFGWTFRVKFVDLTRSNSVNNISVVHVMVPIIAPLFEFRPNLANFVTWQATNFHHVLKQCFSISITIYFPDKSCDKYGKQCFFYLNWR